MNTYFEGLERIYEVSGCKTQKDLAQILGIRQSSISDAKRRQSIPAEWLVTLLRIKGANPDWILTGAGSRFLVPAEGQTSSEALMKAFLKAYSSQELAEELVRRSS